MDGTMMSKVIRIMSAKAEDTGKGYINLIFNLNIDGKTDYLWYQTEKEWDEYLCYDIADGVIVSFLPIAMKKGYDIETELPVSRKLMYCLNSQVIPQLYLNSKDAYRTKITGGTVDKKYEPTATATAMSLGVDSFTTYFEYTVDCPEYADRLTHMTYFKLGDHNYSKEGGDALYQKQLVHVKKFCKEYHWPLITLKSNVDEFISINFGNEVYENIFPYMHAGGALLFQKLIKNYYHSASFNLDEFKCDLNDDASLYEKWLLPNLSTESLTFYESNEDLTRVEKTAYISKFKETYDYLNVCYLEGDNCGKCYKCIRTLLTLDKFGVVDKYAESFNVGEYKKNKRRIITEMVAYEDKCSINREVSDLIDDEKTLLNRICGNWIKLRRTNPLLSKLAQKLYLMKTRKNGSV